jgi:hypothetical protein
METIESTSIRPAGTLIAHLWDRGKSGWDLEIASGNIQRGFIIHSYTNYAKKIDAKKAAKAAGAMPWNF